MEKISLKKFEDFQINNGGLKTIKAGMGTCTGGGFENTWLRDGSSYVLASTLSWSSDSTDERGFTTYNDKKIKTYKY